MFHLATPYISNTLKITITITIRDFFPTLNIISSTPNIIFKIPTLPLFTSSSSSSSSSLFLGYLFLHTPFISIFFCLSYSFHVVVGLVEVHYRGGLFVVFSCRRGGCCGATTKDVSFFHLQL